MTYTRNRVVHDADSHVMETRNWLEPFIESKFAGQLPPVMGEDMGRIEKIIDEARARKHDKVAAASAAENPIGGTKGWGAYGAFDPAERKEALDGFGFSSQLVFPTIGLGPMKAAKDDATRYAAARAYNRSVASFCADDKRLIPVAYVPLDNVELALAATKEALADGSGAVSFSNGPAGDRSPGHHALDPFWELLSERRVPFVLHIGLGTMVQPQPFRNNGRERSPDLH
ncbi:MAG TPA: amidohydrolase family protein, partial [Polyangiales bacterium]|nr:amidohydrolase family protein [Polyangiales bacterium]